MSSSVHLIGHRLEHRLGGATATFEGVRAPARARAATIPARNALVGGYGDGDGSVIGGGRVGGWVSHKTRPMRTRRVRAVRPSRASRCSGGRTHQLKV